MLISLTTFFSWLWLNETDPDGTMTWFINQLSEAELAGDKVHVVAHIPGGGMSCGFYY
jgi:sphingomyelin phosphodiesterase